MAEESLFKTIIEGAGTVGGVGAILNFCYQFIVSKRKENKKVLLGREKRCFNKLLDIQSKFLLDDVSKFNLQVTHLKLLKIELPQYRKIIKGSPMYQKIIEVENEITEIFKPEKLTLRPDKKVQELLESKGKKYQPPTVPIDVEALNFKLNWNTFMEEYSLYLQDQEIKNG